MNVHISIPELDERNLTTEEFFRVVYVMLVHEMKYLMEIHPSEAINNIEDYPLQLAKRIVESAHDRRSLRMISISLSIGISVSLYSTVA